MQQVLEIVDINQTILNDINLSTAMLRLGDLRRPEASYRVVTEDMRFEQLLQRIGASPVFSAASPMIAATLQLQRLDAQMLSHQMAHAGQRLSTMTTWVLENILLVCCCCCCRPRIHQHKNSDHHTQLQGLSKTGHNPGSEFLQAAADAFASKAVGANALELATTTYALGKMGGHIAVLRLPCSTDGPCDLS